MKLNNKYYLLRHGEAMSNVKQVVSSWPETFENPLIPHGRDTIQESAGILKGKGIDLIFASDLLRTKQTAEIVGKALNIKPEFDKRLREISFGNLNGGPITDLDINFKEESERIKNNMPGGESYEDVSKRVYEFLMDIDGKYQGKNILIISHECPLWILEAKVHGMSLEEHIRTIPRDQRIHKGQVKELN